jgi:ABC-type glycerol-3-phosphate transport system substrate-binding protein
MTGRRFRLAVLGLAVALLTLTACARGGGSAAAGGEGEQYTIKFSHVTTEAIIDAKTSEVGELTDEQRQAFKDKVVPSVWKQYADVVGADLVDELLAGQG